jgi:NADH dehydrogenase
MRLAVSQEVGMKRVIIVGAGFGGLRAARVLANQGVDVLLVDRCNYHLFHPLLYQVATASVEQENIVYPIRAIIRRWRNTRFLMAEVHGVDWERRQVLTEHGAIDYDYLILAAGSVTNYYGIESVSKLAFELKQLADAAALRNHILGCFERAAQESDPALRTALLTLVVVGGGATGVEFCGACAELVRHALVKDFPELRGQKARIVLVEAMDALLSMFPSRLQQYALRRLERLGVEVRLGASVVDAKPGQVFLRDGSTIACQTLFWAAGVKAASLGEFPQASKGSAARVRVNPDLTLVDHTEAFVIGDMAFMEQDGTPLPMVAPVALQQGDYAAQAILARERGQPVAPFRYRDKGSMAIIGRYCAVARAMGVNLSGFLAWFAWLALHLYYLIGFRNRLMALLNWAYAYLLLDPKLRVIVGDRPLHEPPKS